jgi:hypothetical protein
LDTVGRVSFELRWYERRVFGSKTTRRFLDYVVDGESLYERHGFDLITPLGWSAADDEERAARRLLGHEPPDIGDRVAIYVCPECGDLLCGAITAVIDRNGVNVVWRDLAWSTVDFPDFVREHSPLRSGWPPLRFNATQYFNAIVSRPTSRRT